MKEIKKVRCPHCGSENVDFGSYDTEWDSDLSMICTWDARCDDCCEDFIISEVLEVTDRIVAKDSDDLDRQVHEMNEE